MNIFSNVMTVSFLKYSTQWNVGKEKLLSVLALKGRTRNQVLVDSHGHWLPGVDDGARTAEEGIEMVRALADMGFRKLIATPHIMADRYESDPEKLRLVFRSFEEKVKNA